jgi:hypothetical protein
MKRTGKIRLRIANHVVYRRRRIQDIDKIERMRERGKKKFIRKGSDGKEAVKNWRTHGLERGESNFLVGSGLFGNSLEDRRSTIGSLHCKLGLT